jgi:hypothetical protein
MNSTLTIPVAFTTPAARDTFKRLADLRRAAPDARAWAELLLIGDRVVVKHLDQIDEQELRAELDRMVNEAEERARREVASDEASRRELLDALLEQSRLRATTSPFRPQS